MVFFKHLQMLLNFLYRESYPSERHQLLHFGTQMSTYSSQSENNSTTCALLFVSDHLQVALSVAVVIENIAVEVKSLINETEFEGILGRDVESSHLTKTLVINNEHWCDGKIHGAAAGVYKPYSAVCNWALDRSYKVDCETADHSQAVWA